MIQPPQRHKVHRIQMVDMETIRKLMQNEHRKSKCEGTYWQLCQILQHEKDVYMLQAFLVPGFIMLILCPVSRIALVSPERSKQIETILLRMAQSGQLKNRVTEEQLIDLLNQVKNLSCSPIRYKLIKIPQMEHVEGKTTVQKPKIVVSSHCFPRPRFDLRIVSPKKRVGR